MDAVNRELRMLSRSLLSRIRADLLSTSNDGEAAVKSESNQYQSRDHLPTRQWLAYPRTLRLTTRPRPPLNPDGTRSRTFNRISRSCDFPSIALNLNSCVEELSERLVEGTLIPLFTKLHPEKSGWNLSLMNLCATNISLTAASVRDGAGRDISKMFQRQEKVLKDWKVEAGVHATDMDGRLEVWDKRRMEAIDSMESGSAASAECVADLNVAGHAQTVAEHSAEDIDTWQSDDDVSQIEDICMTCGIPVPHFAAAAHDRFHRLPD